MIRLSKQLLLLQNLKELSQAGLNANRWQELVDEHGAEPGIEWEFDRAFFDEKEHKLTLIGRNRAQPKNEEWALTLTLECNGKQHKVTRVNLATP